jgi:hypothetical protein
MDPGLPFADLLVYNTDETEHWKRWFGENAAALDLACDVAGAASVRNLLLHIFATELFFANRVLDLPKADHDHLPHATLNELSPSTPKLTPSFRNSLRKRRPKNGRRRYRWDFVTSKPASARWSRRPSGTASIIAGNWQLSCVSRDSSRTGFTTFWPAR